MKANRRPGAPKLLDYIGWRTDDDYKSVEMPALQQPIDDDEDHERVDDLMTARMPVVRDSKLVSSITESLLAISTLPMPIPHLVQREQKQRDYWLWLVGIVATVVSICATVYYYNAHEILLYDDAISHLRIGRSVFDSLTPGLAQLGSVWLPLPHILFWPFVWNNFLWQTGLAGTFESMPCYVIACILLFLIIRRLTHSIPASLVGTAVFLVNPNILYLQSTPLSELLCIVTYAWTAYMLLIWLEKPTTQGLVLLAIATFFATLSRYDGWPLFGAVWMIILLAHLRWHTERSQVFAEMIVFTGIAIAGIVLWLIWNKMLFGDPLYFQHSLYSSQSQQIPFRRGGQLFSYHSVWQSIRFYAIDAAQNIGTGLALTGCIGFALYIAFGWKKVESLFALALLVPFAFYVLSLYTGQAIIWIPGANPTHAPVYMFNVRYGAQMIPPAAIFCGLLIAYLLRIPWVKYMVPILFLLAIAVQVFVTSTHGVVTVQDGQYNISCQSQRQIIRYLHQHWNGGLILEDVFTTKFDGSEAGIDFKNVIYEGSYGVWDQALERPQNYAEWVILNPTNRQDLVTQHIDINNSGFQSSYALVLTQLNGIRLYRRRGPYTLANRPALPQYSYPHHACVY